MDDLILPAAQAGVTADTVSEAVPVEVRPPIGEAEIRRAGEILEAYRQGKAALDKRIKDEEIVFLMEQYKEQDQQDHHRFFHHITSLGYIVPLFWEKVNGWEYFQKIGP